MVKVSVRRFNIYRQSLQCQCSVTVNGFFTMRKALTFLFLFIFPLSLKNYQLGYIFLSYLDKIENTEPFQELVWEQP